MVEIMTFGVLVGIFISLMQINFLIRQVLAELQSSRAIREATFHG